MVCNAKRVLELGTLGSYSTIWIARALPENGKVISIEVDKQHSDVAQKIIGKAGLSLKVDLIFGKALVLLPKIISESKEPFDMIFIDADMLVVSWKWSFIHILFGLSLPNVCIHRHRHKSTAHFIAGFKKR